MFMLVPIQILIRIGIKNYADPHADPTQVSHVLEIRFFFLLVTALQVYTVLSVSSVSKMS